MPQYKHFFITGNATSEKFTSPRSGGGSTLIPQRSRASHSRKLLREFRELWRNQEALKQQREAQSIPTSQGTYVQFTSALDHDLVTKSLENLRQGIRLLNVQEEVVNEHKRVKATVYVPHGKENYFIDKIKDYRDKPAREGSENPKNKDLVNSIEDISVALLEGLWTDKPAMIPGINTKWCEVWLNIEDSKIDEQLREFTSTLDALSISRKPNYILFPERAVVLIEANRDNLIELMLRSDLLAEFRAGQEAAGFWMNETSIDQQAWVSDLLARLSISEDIRVKVVILDKGVNNGHQLLQPLLADSDMLSTNSDWGTHDHHDSFGGHGTLMAGLVGYGALESLLPGTASVIVTHKLCSVKILPPATEESTPKELWGDITAQGISRAEIENPEKTLLYCMAVTSIDDTQMGRPSSWSGAVDNLTFGNGENQRLIIISGGNLFPDVAGVNYPEDNFVTSIQNPAQSWNALTVGAYTDKIQVNDPRFSSHVPVAEQGQLSPFSSTSVTWERKWPLKPDVVFEGGNLLRAPDTTISGHDDLELLSTSKNFNIRPFHTINATSAATALAGWFAAKIAHVYPEAWPETLRGLIIHSASWKASMLSQLNVQARNRNDYRNLVKVFGYGVPDLEKAMYSSESALTYISQEIIQPYAYKLDENNRPTSRAVTNDIHFYNLPWPQEDLLSLGSTPVKLKITLSYFIEPGAGAIGWKYKYRYASHGLRFDLNNIGESIEDFKRRINAEARAEDEDVPTGNSGSDRWTIGSNVRSNGSVHSDYWEGTAAELATCNLIGIYPVIGWWRERKHLGKVEESTRYSLIVSLETPAQDVELYSTVRAMIETPVRITTR